ncbi:MAG: glycoside-pentoside-hexuronide (GPH):cation symporter [Pseudomonadota bacterium]
MGKLKKLAGYGVGDFGLNIYWHTISIWLVYWYTNIVGIPPETAGILWLIGTLWDAVSDPIVAGASERVKTRFGTYRPFLLYAGFGLGLAFALLFWVPPVEGTGLLVSLVGIAILFRTSYTLVAIPYAAMSARLTYDSVERTELSGVRMLFAFSGLLVVSLLLPPLVRWFSGGPVYTNNGFQAVIIVGACVATTAILLCFLFTRELPVPDSAATANKPVRVSLLRRFRENWALSVLLVIIFLQSGANASLMISMVYFIDANGGLFADKEVVMTAFAVATMVGVMFWTLFIRRTGKKLSWCIASVCIATSGLHMLFFGPAIFMGVPLQVVFFGFFLGAFAVLLWSFIPDTVEYGQYKSGQRSEGLVFGSVLVVQKISGGVMGVLVTQVLSRIGYDPSQVEQGAEVGRSLIVFMAISPSALLALSIIPVCIFPLNRHIHFDIVVRLSGGEDRTAKEDPA